MDKNAIKRYAVWARRELISRVSQRAAQYEITADGYGDQNAASVHGRILSADEKKQRAALIVQIKEKGYEQVMEEIAYTWFNRFSALRFMEVNGYLPTRVRVFTDDENNFKPQILTEAINMELDGLDMQKVYDLKNANPKARISVKLVSEAGVGTIACGVAKAGAQVILISGYDGGTGAAPYSSIHHAGLPWELGVAEAQQALMENGLRDRVVLETDSKLMTGRDVAIAALLGAEEYGFATAPLVALGCSMMRVCSKDTCPQGIATQNPELRKRFKGKPEHVINYMCFVAQELREIMAALGFHTVSEMIGRTDCLQPKAHQITHRAETVKLSGILDTAYAGAKGSHFDPKKVYDFKLQETVDESQIIPEFKRALKTGEKHSADFTIKGTDRTLGTIFGSEVTQRFGDSLEEDTFTIHCHGAGGQSFGAFLPKGVTLTLEGDANDGVGKGLSGGKIVVTPPEGAAYQAADNIIVGNVALYGATSGTAYFTGIAGERFLVRNSGATAVAEGCGDHGLEYMTGGRAVILGPTGKNLAAGMSGGIAYVLDMNHDVYRKLNKDMVFMTEVTEKYDVAELRQIITDYMEATHSVRAQEIMDDFENYLPYFKKIIPNDYHKMILSISHFEEQGISHENAVKEAFQAMQANA